MRQKRDQKLAKWGYYKQNFQSLEAAPHESESHDLPKEPPS